MTDREQLIDLIQNAVGGCAKHWAEVIADHLLANGVIVPPCKVGVNVYFAGLGRGECLCGELKSYCLDSHLWFNCHYDGGLNYWHPIEDFGTRVFLTKEEAEQALKEREGK